jgi:hypothetical protein
MTATRYKVLGIPMQRQSARRKLVVVTYAALAGLCSLNLWGAHNLGFWPGLYAGLFVGIFIFGGRGRYGLIKPFVNKPLRVEPAMVNLVRLHLDPASAGTPDASTWMNDERELSRRDLAHYRAYQPMTIAMTVILVLAAMTLHPTRWIAISVLQNLLFAVVLFTTVLAITLPSAIILWTEPDVDLG